MRYTVRGRYNVAELWFFELKVGAAAGVACFLVGAGLMATVLVHVIRTAGSLSGWWIVDALAGFTFWILALHFWRIVSAVLFWTPTRPRKIRRQARRSACHG